MSGAGDQPVLVVGSAGMLGREVVGRARGQGCHVVAMDGSVDLDITDERAVQELISRVQPGLVINCAGYTDVDGAEADEARATRVNGEGPLNLANACGDAGCLLVHYSTDYVFDGAATSPIAVDGPTGPINAYGRSKLAGEEAILGSGCEHLILRTSWLFGASGTNFVRTMLRLGAERESLRVVDDQVGRPTSAVDLAHWTLTLVELNTRGVFHLANGGECTWYEFARQIMGCPGIDCVVEPCRTTDFPRPAARPRYSVLDLAETEAILGPLRNWKDALAECLNVLASQTTTKDVR